MARPALFALSLLLVLAATGTPAGAQTSSDTSLVHLGPADGGTHAFVAWPAGARPVPSIVIVHEWWGLNAQVRRQARTLARQGYVVVIPDLYRGRVASEAEYAQELSRGLEDERAIADLDASIQWLRTEERTHTGAIGIVGFGMGGRLAEEMALRSPELAAAVMFYGPPITNPERLEGLRVPLLAHFGSEDRGIPAARVEALREGLRKAGKTGDVYLYSGAGHAFMNETRDSFHPDAARLAWARTLAYLQRTLKGDSD